MSGFDRGYGGQRGSSSGPSQQQLMLQRLHANSHQTTFIGAWLLAGFAILTIVTAMFVMIGVWQNNTNQTENFKNFCYAVWTTLGVGLVLVIAFLIYFHWNMTNLWKKGRANIDLAFSSDPYGDSKDDDDQYSKRIKEAKQNLELEKIKAEQEKLRNQRSQVTRSTGQKS